MSDDYKWLFFNLFFAKTGHVPATCMLLVYYLPIRYLSGVFLYEYLLGIFILSTENFTVSIHNYGPIGAQNHPNCNVFVNIHHVFLNRSKMKWF